MPLTSASTLAQIIAQMEDNASYAANESLAQCLLFIDAANRFKTRVASRTVHGGRGGGEELDYGTNLEIVERDLRTANAWRAAKGGGSAGSGASVVYADTSGGRE